MRNYSVLLLALLIITGFASCSSKKESHGNSNTVNKSRVAVNTSKQSQIDIKDMNSIYEFINKNVAKISRKDFNKWRSYYFDITGNGSDEAVFVGPYGKNWSGKLLIIGSSGEHYKIIPSNITLGKYGNKVEFKNGLLSVQEKTGGTGELFTTMNLFAFNGFGMANVLDNITLSHVLSVPNESFEETGIINGSLNDFEYTLTRYNKRIGKKDVRKHTKYTYNPGDFSYRIRSLDNRSAEKVSDKFSNSGVQPLLIYYENKNYVFDLSGKNSFQNFLINTDHDEYFDLVVNFKKYHLKSKELYPALIYNRYKLTRINNSGKFAFTFFTYDPPKGFQIVFMIYSQNKGILKLGTVKTAKDLIKSNISKLTYKFAVIGNKRYKLE